MNNTLCVKFSKHDSVNLSPFHHGRMRSRLSSCEREPGIIIRLSLCYSLYTETEVFKAMAALVWLILENDIHLLFTRQE